MRASQTASGIQSCSLCHQHTDERCSWCLLLVCSEHGKPTQPWFTRRQVLVCTSCHARLQEIAQEEERSSLAATTQYRASVVHMLAQDCDAIVSAHRRRSCYT